MTSDLLNKEKLNEVFEILIKFLIYYIFIKRYDFLEQKINKLDIKISFLICNKLIRRCEGDEYKLIKEYIYKKHLNKLDNIDYIIKLIDSLDQTDIIIFFRGLMKKISIYKSSYMLPINRKTDQPSII
jgi:hypothetical protein